MQWFFSSNYRADLCLWLVVIRWSAFLVVFVSSSTTAQQPEVRLWRNDQVGFRLSLHGLKQGALCFDTPWITDSMRFRGAYQPIPDSFQTKLLSEDIPLDSVFTGQELITTLTMAGVKSVRRSNLLHRCLEPIDADWRNIRLMLDSSGSLAIAALALRNVYVVEDVRYGDRVAADSAWYVRLEPLVRDSGVLYIEPPVFKKEYFGENVINGFISLRFGQWCSSYHDLEALISIARDKPSLKPESLLPLSQQLNQASLERLQTMQRGYWEPPTSVDSRGYWPYGNSICGSAEWLEPTTWDQWSAGENIEEWTTIESDSTQLYGVVLPRNTYKVRWRAQWSRFAPSDNYYFPSPQYPGFFWATDGEGWVSDFFDPSKPKLVPSRTELTNGIDLDDGYQGLMFTEIPRGRRYTLELAHLVNNRWVSLGLFPREIPRVQVAHLSVKSPVSVRERPPHAFHLFPNPSSGQVTIGESDIGWTSYQITSVNGLSVLSGTLAPVQGSKTIDVGGLPNGAYIIVLEDALGRRGSRLLHILGD